MKFSKVSLLVASASVVLSAPVAVTVTKHVHEAATVVVQGIVYVENGQTQTSFVTKAPHTHHAGTATVVATATTSAPIVVAEAQVDSVVTTVVQESAASEETATQQSTPADVTTSSPATTTDTPATTTSDIPATTTASPAITTDTPTTTTASPTTTTDTPTTPSTTQSTASATQSSSSSDFSTSMVNEHNTKRALHKDTGSLTWSDTLATYAQNYANSYDCSGNLVHSGGEYGENLALGYGTTGSVDAWYNEISSYDYSNPGFSEDAGHFTQVVWKGTTQVGCGLKSCGGVWGDYIICSYKDAGNVIGDFADNVMPLA
ncbi:pry2p [Saccharomyces arboricola H-6]|uniref:Pry2p n=1 Tax=Saccharomyces arboricola (strain H-6 / AS 2.3317 / CBS 10644) TaxID=1160507 RepID=J8PLC1_SACAR|nr:pry2p [Saccharomyces arboricola H-6]